MGTVHVQCTQKSGFDGQGGYCKEMAQILNESQEIGSHPYLAQYFETLALADDLSLNDVFTCYE